MVPLLVAGGLLSIWIFHLDPLAVIACVVVLYYWDKQRTLKQAVTSLEYWKGREYDLKDRLVQAKEDDKERRLNVREARATRRRKTVRLSKEIRLMDKMFTDKDRGMMRLMTAEQRAKLIYKQYGLKPEAADAWLFMDEAELQKRKLGIDEDDVD